MNWTWSPELDQLMKDVQTIEILTSNLQEDVKET